MTVKDIMDKLKKFKDDPVFPKVLIAVGILLMLIILLSAVIGIAAGYAFKL